jgi:hypothetical protein
MARTSGRSYTEDKATAGRSPRNGLLIDGHGRCYDVTRARRVRSTSAHNLLRRKRGIPPVPHDLFISYSRRDNQQGQVTALKEQIEADYREFAVSVRSA